MFLQLLLCFPGHCTMLADNINNFTKKKFNTEHFTVLKKGDLSKDPTETLLLIYEFEARAKINDSTLEHVLEAVLELQHLEPKTLETIASLAMEPPAHFPSVCKKALKNAWLLHRKCSLIDGVKCSKCLHSLIQLTLPSGTLGIEPRILEEVWSYYEEGLFVIDSVHDYPEVEILWLMTRAWNTGILLYSVGRYMEAERWCGLGMRFLKHLGSLQSSYESQLEIPEPSSVFLFCQPWKMSLSQPPAFLKVSLLQRNEWFVQRGLRQAGQSKATDSK
ncbi:testis-expressed protein 11 isoform X2 [Protopterus annectens]|uniref:testis-expressed protein 11 isoform X2 n=1 Tax=Protopterus annectens TaxID=7888 RepID=UPI001CFBCBA4|nr:testis-expressed protein 11 isoform X2 [Protopterus annectens]